MTKYIDERKGFTLSRIAALREHLSGAEALLAEKACVYMTGSFGRLEAGDYSDLDIFIVSKVAEKQQGSHTIKIGQLTNLNSIIIKSDLIKASRALNIPDFDADGKFLASHNVHELTNYLGSQEDDYRNTLTGRLLLFLESQPLLGADVYNDVIADVIAAYFGDYETHSDNFVPAFLANDILRLWRTFCVNYEFGRRGREEQGKVKNYKLKHSRMLTCYSALIYLLAVSRLNKTVSIEATRQMTAMTPTARLLWVSKQPQFSDAVAIIEELLALYEKFLRDTNLPKEEIQEAFKRNTTKWSKDAYRFGDLMAQALRVVGEKTTLYRLLLV